VQCGSDKKSSGAPGKKYITLLIPFFLSRISSFTYMRRMSFRRVVSFLKQEVSRRWKIDGQQPIEQEDGQTALMNWLS